MRNIAVFQTVTLFRDNKRHRHLPFQRIFHADHRHFRDVRIAGNTLLYLAGAQPVSGHVYHIIGAA
ncbi:hypothetical protein D3C81_1635960 [compost metagenome]